MSFFPPKTSTQPNFRSGGRFLLGIIFQQNFSYECPLMNHNFLEMREGSLYFFFTEVPAELENNEPEEIQVNFFL